MPVRNVPNGSSVDIMKQQMNLLGADMGSIADLTTPVTTTMVDSLNSINDKIDTIVIGSIFLPYDIYLTSNNTGSGTTLGSNPLAAVDTTPTVTVTHTAHGYTTGKTIAISGASTFAGISAIALNGRRVITVVNANSYTFVADANATSTASGGGAAVVVAGTTDLIKGTTGGNVQIGGPIQNISIVSGTITGITPLGIAAGGTGGGDQTAAQTALGLLPGTNVQAYNAKLQSIAAMTPSTNDIMVYNGSSWVAQSPTEARATLSVKRSTDGSPGASTVQSWSTGLDQISAIPPTLGVVIVGNGTSWAAQDAAAARQTLGVRPGVEVQAYSAILQSIVTGGTPSQYDFIVGGPSGTYLRQDRATARSSMGLGSIATQAASAVAITGGTIAGTTISTSTLTSPTINTPTISGGTVAGSTMTGVSISSSSSWSGGNIGGAATLTGCIFVSCDTRTLVPSLTDTYGLGSDVLRFATASIKQIRNLDEIASTVSMVLGSATAATTTGIRSGSAIWYQDAGTFRPDGNNTRNFGSVAYRIATGYFNWLDIGGYITGDLFFSANGSTIGQEALNYITFYGTTGVTTFYANNLSGSTRAICSLDYNSFYSSPSSIDLGKSSGRWKDIYYSGILNYPTKQDWGYFTRAWADRSIDPGAAPSATTVAEALNRLIGDLINAGILA